MAVGSTARQPVVVVTGAVALTVFILTRVFVLLHPPVMSDVNMYYELSKRAAWGTLEVYKDFPFAYPFLSWLAISWPPLLSPHLSFECYQNSLHFFFFSLEFLAVGSGFIYFRRDGARLQTFARALLIYSLLSALQFNLIYDRVDLLMTLAMLAAFVFWQRGVGLPLIAGFLLKLVPIALWPFKFVGLWRENRKRAVSSVWIPLTAIGLLILSDRVLFRGEIVTLSKHSSRGIQVESLWATPFELMHILGFDPNGRIEMIFGAHEIVSDFLTDGVLLAAKIFGFALMAALYVFANIEMRTLRGRARGFLIFILAFLCFQRVLSTQFLLWAAPFIAIHLALDFDLLFFVLSMVVFALTCVIFSPGYGGIITYDPLFTSVLAARNLGLLALFALSLRARGLGQHEV